MAKGRSSRRKLVFNEIARQIIARDRLARKYGRSQNTIGEIARMLEWAYLAGGDGETFENPNALPAQEGAAVVDWIEIPPRPREVFWELCSLRIGDDPAQHSGSDLKLFAKLDEGGKLKWGVQTHDQCSSDFGWSESTITPLLKLGLLEPDECASNSLRITKKGLNTWVAYKQREEAGDPTLPMLNIRA